MTLLLPMPVSAGGLETGRLELVRLSYWVQSHFPVFRQSLDHHLQYLCIFLIDWDVYFMGSTLSPLYFFFLLEAFPEHGGRGELTVLSDY